MSYKIKFLTKGDSTEYTYTVVAESMQDALHKLKLMATTKKIKLQSLVSIVGWGEF